MKFRTKIEDLTCIQHLTSVVGAISKLAKDCVLRLTPDMMYFILCESVANGGIHMWCELSQANFCQEYAIQGVSEDANEIYMEMSPDCFLRALKTAQVAHWVKMKLTNKHTPCLTVEVEQPTVGSFRRLAVHDIPITIIKRQNWDSYTKPQMSKFDVSIGMPPAKVLKNVVDKMKNISNFVCLSANLNGEMWLSVETDMVSINTHFQYLYIPTGNHGAAVSGGGSASSGGDQGWTAEARVDIRRLAQFLSSQQAIPSQVLCNIVHRRAIQFIVTHGNMMLQFVLPVAAK